jgi:hypothetical protein
MADWEMSEIALMGGAFELGRPKLWSEVNHR